MVSCSSFQCDSIRSSRLLYGCSLSHLADDCCLVTDAHRLADTCMLLVSRTCTNIKFSWSQFFRHLKHHLGGYWAPRLVGRPIQTVAEVCFGSGTIVWCELCLTMLTKNTFTHSLQSLSSNCLFAEMESSKMWPWPWGASRPDDEVPPGQMMVSLALVLDLGELYPS